MNRKTFLTTIAALFAAPFALKSKEKIHITRSNGGEGGYGPDYPRLPYHGDWRMTEKDGLIHITHQYINGKWVDVNELI